MKGSGIRLLIPFCFIVTSLFYVSHEQLVVNVKNEGGEVTQEVISSNVTEDTVTLLLRTRDGTSITQLIDFQNEVQIFRSVILGEEELGQGAYQVLCFVVHFSKNEFISSDAMSKLRQKNPHAIRHPDEVKEEEVINTDLSLDPSHSQVISPHIATTCADAATYAKEADMKLLTKTLGKDLTSAFNGQTQPLPACADTRHHKSSCNCSYHLCINWYPCGLKYCRGKDSTGKTVSYRCGIKTCRKCRVFQYNVTQKFLCLWNDIPS